MRRRLLAVCAIAAVAAWHLALRASFLRLPLVIDEGEYAYAAGVWADGGLPYRDAASQKPPTILAFYRAGLALGGPESGPRALGILVSLLTAALLAAATPRDWSAGARLAPAAAFAALSTLPVGDYGVPLNTEALVCLFLAGAALAVLRGRPGLAGALCGAAFMSKPTALLSVAAFGALAAWTGPRRFSRSGAALFAGAALLVPAGWAAYFAARGGLSAMLGDAFSGNLSYASVVASEGLAPQLRWLALFLGPKLAAGAWPALALAGWGLAGLRVEHARRPAVLAVAWLGTALGGALVGFFFFPHYFLAAAAPLALCAGWGAQKAARRWGPRAAWAAAAAVALLPALPYAGSYLQRDQAALARALLYPNPVLEDRELGLALRGLTTPGQTLYVYGSEPSIYVYARRRCATPTSFVYLLTLRRPRPGAVDAELARLRARPPAYVVYSRQPLSSLIAHVEGLRLRDGVRAWLASDYELVEERPVGGAARPAAPGETPDFSPADSLLLFRRRAARG